MRKVFPGYFQKKTKQIQDIWQDSVFMLDANILLNLYRYSDSTKDDFLSILKNRKIREKLWLPHQAVYEYLENRASVISAQSKKYNVMIDSIKSFKANLDNKRQHPFISDELKLEVDDVLGKLSSELVTGFEQHQSRHTIDPIREELDQVIGENITPRYDDEKLKEIFEDGQARYKEQIPPGYKDNKKDSYEDGIKNNSRVFGDLILWNQIIDFSSERKCNVIFVTDDRKEDWWVVESGRVLGPRPELIEEFEIKTEQSILIYSAENFFERSSKFLNQKISKDSKDEISDITQQMFKLNYEVSDSVPLDVTNQKVIKRLSGAIKRLKELETYKQILTEKIEHLRKFGNDSEIIEVESMIEDVKKNLSSISQEIINLTEIQNKNRSNMKKYNVLRSIEE